MAGPHTLGFTANGASGHWFWTSGTGTIFLAKSTTASPIGNDIYVDSINIQIAHEAGANRNLQFALYNSSNVLLGVTDTTVVVATISPPANASRHVCTFNANNLLHVAAGTSLRGAVRNTGSGGLYVTAYNDSGNFDFLSNSSGFPGTFSGSNKVWGGLPWYATYWNKCTISSITSTPVFPGQTFDVFGDSFDAGGAGSGGGPVVKVNGVTCSGVSVISGSHLTATVPVGATTGPVTVETYAGTGTSGSNLTVSGGRIFHSGALVSASSVRIFHSGSLVNVVSVRTAKNVSGSLVLTDVH